MKQAAWVVIKYLKREGIKEESYSSGSQEVLVSQTLVCVVKGGPPASRLGDLILSVSHAGSLLLPRQQPHCLPGSCNGYASVRTQYGGPSESGDIFRLVETVSRGLLGGASSLPSL